MSYCLPQDKFPSKKEDESIPHNEINTDDLELLEIAHLAKEKSRLSPKKMENVILQLCKGRFLTVEQISLLVSRKQK
ncbi:hypothetical protein MNBD_PLANCTO02-1128, partial [hydrothermal vent metagenome]